MCIRDSYGTDLTQVEMLATISARATMTPASGTKLDFSKGPVTITVTAENGSVQEYVVTTTAASSASGLAALRLSIGSASDPADLTSGNYSERFLLDVKDFKPEQDRCV